MRVREAQKHTDPDADPDPPHWVKDTIVVFYGFLFGFWIAHNVYPHILREMTQI
jgi:hypothetical protein